VNKWVLQAEIVQILPLRYTPAGIPLLNFMLHHVSEQVEAGLKRKVECEVNAVVLGELALNPQIQTGKRVKVSGFLAKRSMKSTQLVMHVNQIAFQD
jgi:primosomal replication protein N